MSKDSGATKKDFSGITTRSKERIIPIQLETDEQPKVPTVNRASSVNVTPRLNKVKQVPTIVANKREELSPSPLSDTDSDVMIINESNSSDDITKDVEPLPERPIPPICVPEKIIIILDTSLDENFTSFDQKSGKKYNPLYMLQSAIQIFLYNKHLINSEHEFALMILNDNSATWVHDFTSLPEDIIASLSTIKPCKPEDIFIMDSVFDLICENAVLPSIKDVTTPFVVRAILLYGRSYSIPVLKETPKILDLLNSPLFTFDVIMTHEPPSIGNHCSKIFETLQKIDKKGFSYAFSVSRNSKDLYLAMAKVLGHSLQRPPQSVLNYDIKRFKM